MEHIEDHINKGNLSTSLKLKLVQALIAMVESDDPVEKEFAISTLIEQRRVLSYWPENTSQD